MREIRFRAWDKKYNSFSEEPFFRLLIAKDGQVYNTEEDHWYKPEERYVIQFYTGLKDKNGREIYEGDIVKCPNEINKETFGEYSLKEVKFNNGGFLVSYLRCEKGQVIPRDYTASFFSQYGDPKLMLWGVDPRRMDNMEVIGNICENKTLIEK